MLESLRSISEILIWGDQNDASVFDYFLEKQMLSFFVTITKKCSIDGGGESEQQLDGGEPQRLRSLWRAEPAAASVLDRNHMGIQVLQLLNILFENISQETSLYYLLSNNHINNIIDSAFDFSDEEVSFCYANFVSGELDFPVLVGSGNVHAFFQ